MESRIYRLSLSILPTTEGGEAERKDYTLYVNGTDEAIGRMVEEMLERAGRQLIDANTVIDANTAPEALTNS